MITDWNQLPRVHGLLGCAPLLTGGAAKPPLLGCLLLGFLGERLQPSNPGFSGASHPAPSRRHTATFPPAIFFPVSTNQAC